MSSNMWTVRYATDELSQLVAGTRQLEHQLVVREEGDYWFVVHNPKHHDQVASVCPSFPCARAHGTPRATCASEFKQKVATAPSSGLTSVVYDDEEAFRRYKGDLLEVR
jgi:hypothetical protein